jgi:hypothetical protein
VEQIRLYFSSATRGASLQGMAPLDSPATSYTFDLIREGVAVVNPMN